MQKVTTVREIMVLAGVYRNTYLLEANLLEDVKTFTACIDKCLLVRQEAVSVSGVADVLFCLNGMFIAAELKQCSGVPTPQQIEWLREAAQAGAICGVVRNIADLADLFIQAKEKKFL